MICADERYFIQLVSGIFMNAALWQCCQILGQEASDNVIMGRDNALTNLQLKYPTNNQNSDKSKIIKVMTYHCNFVMNNYTTSLPVRIFMSKQSKQQGFLKIMLIDTNFYQKYIIGSTF